LKIAAVNNIFKKTIGATLLASALVVATPNLKSQERDTFEKTQVVSPKGTTDEMALLWAPDPIIRIKGQTHVATIVVDLSKNVLYHYDEFGRPKAAYLVASGAKDTPTTKGIRAVTHVESYPYKKAPEQTKRHKNPQNYGPRVICLETVDPKTGKRGVTGEFIHGNNNAASLGKYVSQGCIRMDNEVIKKLANEVKRGDFVLVL